MSVRSYHPPPSRSTGGPARVLGLALAIILLATLLAPLAGSPTVAAQDVPVATEEADTPMPDGGGDGGEFIPEETPVSEETPAVEETPLAEPTTTPEDPKTSGIGVTMWTCDEDHGGDLLQLYSNCQPAYDAALNVYSAGALLASEEGDYFATGLPAGEYAITASVPTGYGEPLAFCGAGPSGGAPPAPGPVAVSDGSYTFALSANETIACDWFHVPAYGTLYVTKWFCPADSAVDWYSPSESDLDRCSNLEAGGVGFDLLSHASGETVTKYTDPNPSGPTSQTPHGTATWEQVPAGSATVTEHARSGYRRPYVLCGASSQPVPVDGSSISLDIPAGGTVQCDWYNIPEADSPVIIYKYFCPEEVAGGPIPADPGDLTKKCEPYKGDEVTFDLYHAGTGKTETRSPNEIKTGAAIWSPLPSGDLTITEHELEGYGSPIVYCGPGRPEDVPDYARYDVEDMSVAVRLGSGVTMYCAWFNIPDDGTDVYIQKWFCPEADEVDYYAEDLDFFMATPNPCELYEDDGVTFDLYSHVSDTTETRTTGATGIPGAVWKNVPDGEVTVTEGGWEGYGTPVVFCGSALGSGYDPFPVEVAGRNADFAIPSDLDEGYEVVCNWFNIPVADGSVTVVKYDCPAGTDYDLGGFDRYDERCDEPAAGVSFKLDGDRTGNPGSKATGADGAVIWDDREPDRYFLTEEVPDGYGTPVVFCDTYVPPATQAPDFDPVSVSGDARIEFGLSEGQAILCVWFNIPVNDYDDPGTVTVIKYWCDGQIVSETTCARYGGGQLFRLRPLGGGEAIALTTGGNGAKTVAVPAGAWKLEEVGAEWCRVKINHTDQDGSLVVAEGRETVVTVYNCGDKPNPEPITKLPNTGSGNTAADLASAGSTDAARVVGLLLATASALALAARMPRRSRRRDPSPPSPKPEHRH